MSRSFTIQFVNYATQRPEFENQQVVMKNVVYEKTPNWHIAQNALQVARNVIVPVDTFVVSGNAQANMSLDGMTSMTGVKGVDDGFGYIPITMDFFFFGTNYKNSSNAPGLYWNTNNVFGFGTGNTTISWLATTGLGVLLGNTDRRTNNFAYSAVSNASNTNYINTVLYAQNIYSDGIQSTIQWQMRLLRSPNYQYIEVRMSTVGATQGQWNITNGSVFQNTFGSFATSAGQKGSSFVLRSDLTGFNWALLYNHYISL